ncbi:glycoside hydrolase family 35 protein [Georgenia faecalis]|uniref:Beta-galactosidase n=1 Tax=Georgenia faecalis TaxID=2483799 RepID=A0ABV9DA31_9MICO|nr:beta-galactosidase family protein [Georgenia faecalis]
MPVFEIGAEDFLLDGRPHQILSGALHYFRVHPDQWADRIAKARLLGLNTIETYVAWNFHAPTADAFDTSGRRDLGRFLDLVADAGMHAIVRPGPYICAEWDNGGLPTWLLREPGVGVRTSEPRYLAAVQGYFDALLPLVVERQVDRGGPVLMVQVENEYGAYGDDAAYLRTLAQMLRDGGVTVPLFTCDQADDAMLARGGLPELHRTATFGSRSPERLATLRRHQPSGPLMCMEYWNGWFDAWGEDHHVTDPGATAGDLAALLASGASVNLYMLHGGTNFGFTNGANHKGVYRPTVTSYDYDAPLAEDGTPTAKYAALAEVLAAHHGTPRAAVGGRAPAPTPQVPVPREVRSLWPLVDAADGWSTHDAPPTHDDLDAFTGFVLYRTEVQVGEAAVLDLSDVRDRAQVFVDGRPVGVVDRRDGDRALTLPGPGAVVLDVLVEDLGRVNYGPRIGEHKGLVGPVVLDGTPVTGWRTLPLPLEDWVAAAAQPGSTAAGSTAAASPPAAAAVVTPRPGPSLTTWDLPGMDAADLFLSTAGWGKGVVWFNGWNLGRFWSAGPQQTLYVPAPLVRPDNNRVVALELAAAPDAALRFVDGPRWTAVTQ